jgi:hypothetical protein
MAPIDYSKFDNIGSDSDNEQPASGGGGGSAAYTPEQRKAFEEAAQKARDAQPAASNDPRSEIDRLKAERRAKAAARDAEAATAPAAAAPPPSAAAAEAVEDEPVEDGPLGQLTAAERLADTIRADIAFVEGALASEASYDAALMQKCTKINGGVGKLQNDLDGRRETGRSHFYNASKLLPLLSSTVISLTHTGQHSPNPPRPARLVLVPIPLSVCFHHRVSS